MYCTYDGFNRLKEVRDNSGETVYTYNADGQSGIIEAPAGTVVRVYANDPTLTDVAYIRGLNLIASVTDGQATYYHYNAHGDVVQTTTAYGAVIHDYSYDAFGVERNADDTDTNPFRYCGEQFDAETGNYYLRARYYTPGVGRFTQADTYWNPSNMVYGDNPQKWNEYRGEDDPLGLHTYTYKPDVTAVAQAGNLYGYGLSNPIFFVDPSGNDAAIGVLERGAELAFASSMADSPAPGLGDIVAAGILAGAIVGAGGVWVHNTFFADSSTASSSVESQAGGETSGRGVSRSDVLKAYGGAASGGPNKNKGKGNLKKVTDYMLKKAGIDAHAFKYEWLGKTNISGFDLVYDTGTKEIFIQMNSTGKLMSTGRFLN